MSDWLKPSTRIFVAGHRGMVGSAILRRLQSLGHKEILIRPHQELDLCNESDTRRFFQTEKPEVVILAAARVGGILANECCPAEFLQINLAIELNVIHQSYLAGVRRLLFLGSSCIYPKFAPQPLREDALLTGDLEPTNRSYAIAKIAGIEMCRAYNRQYGTRFVAAMPCNLYGPNDNFDLNSSHVIPALIRKMEAAKRANAPEVTVWGSGDPRREFLHSDDLAAACDFLIRLKDEQFDAIAHSSQLPMINVGCGTDITIRELARLIADIVGCHSKIVFDTSKPDGTPKKLLDVSRISALGWHPAIPLRQGLEMTYQHFIATLR